MPRPRRWTRRWWVDMDTIVVGRRATNRAMRKLYTVAFPRLNDADARFIPGIRARHDRQARMLGPHFTLLFGCDAVDEATYIEHVRAVAASTAAVRFECR